METLTRLVTDSLARHGFDRPIDPRRLQWSRWFRCDSTHSLLVVPSKPGIFAIAEEVGASVARAPSPATAAQASRNIHLGTQAPESPGKAHVGTAALGCPPERSSGPLPAISSPVQTAPSPVQTSPPLGGAALQRCDAAPQTDAASAAEVARPPHARRPPILRRRRHGLHPRPHVHPHQSHARSPFLRQMFPALRRHRRPGPAPQHLQRPQSMDALLRRKSQRPSRSLLLLGRANHSRRRRKREPSRHRQPPAQPHPRFRSQQESPLSSAPPLGLLTEAALG